MLLAKRNLTGSPLAGPGLLPVESSAACLTGIITGAPVPAPPEACLAGIITAAVTTDSATLAGIVQQSQVLALPIRNTANVHSLLGAVVSHEEVSF